MLIEERLIFACECEGFIIYPAASPFMEKLAISLKSQVILIPIVPILALTLKSITSARAFLRPVRIKNIQILK